MFYYNVCSVKKWLISLYLFLRQLAVMLAKSSTGSGVLYYYICYAGRFGLVMLIWQTVLSLVSSKTFYCCICNYRIANLHFCLLWQISHSSEKIDDFYFLCIMSGSVEDVAMFPVLRCIQSWHTVEVLMNLVKVSKLYRLSMALVNVDYSSKFF